MAHIKKKFTFDNPEDSYWNESGSNSSSLFDDLPSKQWAARAAVDNLFEVREVFSAKIPQLPNNSPTTANSIGATVLKKEARREEAVDDFINHKTANFKIETESSPLHAGGPSAASVVSECSVSSLPSDANRLDLDYSRLKAEHRKLQRHLRQFDTIDIERRTYEKQFVVYSKVIQCRWSGIDPRKRRLSYWTLL